MTAALPDILARIVFRKKEELREALDGAGPSLRALEQAAEERKSQRRDFRFSLKTHRPAIVAEIKQASPSKGVFVEDFRPAEIAREYASGGAAALSVLTDHDFFRGSLLDLESARAAVTIPVLRKDFTIDPYHVMQAAAHGADAILLIAAILCEREMRDLRELAARFGMAALVEVHDAEELEPALASGAEIIGVNNRDLRTFQVDLGTSIRLAERIPSGVLKVSESGVDTRESVRELMNAGFEVFLVGAHLMRAANSASAIRELCS